MSHHRRLRTGLLTASTIAIALGLAVAGTAAAHIEPDPGEIEAGSPATVGFLVEHGCEDANTTALSIQLPEDVTDGAAVEKAGWQTAVEGRVIRFSGGDLDHDTADTFTVSFTAPAEAGTIHFPIVQTCGSTSLDWIEIAADGAAEPEHPAPAVNVVGAAATTTVAPPATTTTEATPPSADTTSADTTVADTEAPAADTVAPEPATTIAAASTVPVDDNDDDDDDGDDSNTGVIVAVVIVAALAVGGGVVAALRRRGSGIR